MASYLESEEAKGLLVIPREKGSPGFVCPRAQQLSRAGETAIELVRLELALQGCETLSLCGERLATPFTCVRLGLAGIAALKILKEASNGLTRYTYAGFETGRPDLHRPFVYCASGCSVCCLVEGNGCGKS